ncbi:hypothetical protein HPP92_005818 [Vanilla planifolia]|uniref:AB hydrolase-1 domain-containing protein n=1 Tax=Vanilla planifolia TaxID=51239 RepID=A0A835RNE5_VANPL|nr:hypothetical protein HPP92_005818 [Vanilla planifolia]
MQVFVVEIGPRESETVLLVHGLGCSSYSFRHVLSLLAHGGLHAVAVDLPCSGFSDEVPLVKNHGEWGGLFGYMWSIYAEIKENGVFSGFDNLIETGEIKDKPVRVSSCDGSREIGQILGQLIGSMALAPVHLVLHDSALVSLANWVFANPGIVSSVTIMDASPQSAAFPSPLLNFPVVGHLLLRSKSLFGGLLRLCCSRSVDGLDAEAYRLLLKRSGRCAWRTLNHSLDVGEWANSEEMKGLPVQVLWSNTLSDRWIDEGRRVASSISRAKLLFHSGNRWPQEDAANEISRMITDFVSSLPKSNRQMEVEGATHEHIQQLYEDAKHNAHHHHHNHGLDHSQGYMGMYGFDHEW